MRLRFAPSPTGALHLGGARTALFNWLVARRSANGNASSGKFFVRIEDTDAERNREAHVRGILRDLRWLGLRWDSWEEEEGYAQGEAWEEGAVFQSRRRARHVQVAEDLMARGLAYPCFASKEDALRLRLEAKRTGKPPAYHRLWRNAPKEEVEARVRAGEPHTVRLKVPRREHKEDAWRVLDDMVRGEIRWHLPTVVPDFVILRPGGYPVYNFCVAVDDVDMRISHVLRGADHLTNSLQQLLVMEAMGVEAPPKYGHLSLMTDVHGQKLSKRRGAPSVNDFRAEGYLPEAIVNSLALMGWHPGLPADEDEGGDGDAITCSDGLDDAAAAVEEIFLQRTDLLAAFSQPRFPRFKPSASCFDPDRLRWINAQHVQGMDDNARVSALLAHAARTVASTNADVDGGASDSESEHCGGVDGSYSRDADADANADADAMPLDRFVASTLLELRNKSAPNWNETLRVFQDSLEFPFLELVGQEGRCSEELVAGAAAMAQDIVAGFRDGVLVPQPDTILETEADLAAALAEFGTRYHTWVRTVGKRHGRRGKQLFHPLRLALTGRVSGPDVASQLFLLHLFVPPSSSASSPARDTRSVFRAGALRATCMSLEDRIDVLENWHALQEVTQRQ